MFLDDEQHERAQEAVAIVRISDENQESGYSKEAQEYRIKEYCLRNGLELVKVFAFTESSTVGDRKKFMEAVSYAKKLKGITAVVTDKVDRLQRSYKEMPLLEELIKKQKIELHFHVENLQIHKHSTHQELMIWDLHVMLAKSYVNSMKENVNRSIAQKLRSGEWISTAPLGYRHIKAGPRDRGLGKIVVDDDRAALVRRIFEEYATGTYTLGEMAKKTKNWGLTNIRGKQSFLSTQQIHSIITNPFYYGMMLYRKRNKLFPHKYPPLISKELYDACQAVRKGWNKKPFKYAGKDYLFRGILRCAVSGRAATADTKKKKYMNGEYAEWTYLIVRNPDNPEKKMNIREEKAIEQVEEVFRSMRISPELLAEVVKEIKSSADVQQDYHERRLAELHKDLLTVKRRMSRLTDLFVDGDINKESHDNRHAELVQERDEIMYEIEQCNRADDSFTNTLIGTVEVASGAYDAFKVGTLEQKRRLMNFVFSNLELKGSTLCYTLKKPFDRFVNASDIKEWRTREDSNPRPSPPEGDALSN